MKYRTYFVSYISSNLREPLVGLRAITQSPLASRHSSRYYTAEVQRFAERRVVYQIRAILLLFCLIFSQKGLSQNLVPNPYFSDFIRCPENRGEIIQAFPWYTPNQKTTDFAHECSTNGITSIPINNWGIEVPAVGQGYAGIRTWLAQLFVDGARNYREYLAVEMMDSLIVGEYYWISFKVSVGDSALYTSDDIGLAFSKTKIPEMDVLPYTPAIANEEGNIIQLSAGWTTISGVYQAQGGERHLVIGNFLDDDHTTVVRRNIQQAAFLETTYFYVDEVIVEPCKGRFPEKMILVEDSTICPREELDLMARSLENAKYLWENEDANSVFTITQAGTYYLRTELEGCVQIDSIEIFEAEVPVFDLGKDTSFCAGETLLLEVPDSVGQIVWNDESTEYFLSVNMGGSYSATAISGKCSFTDSIHVALIPEYVSKIPLDTTICSNTTLQLKPSVEIGVYNWQDQSENFIFSAKNAGEYWVDIQTNCFLVREYFTLSTIDCGCEQFIPNVFTPNGDGVNEYFQPQFREGISGLQVNIYDRWGKLVFQTNDPSAYWDGTFKGKQVPEGVYFWRIQYLCLDRMEDMMVKQEGHLSLFR